MMQARYMSRGQELTAFLADTDLFSGLEEALLHELGAGLETIQVAQGATLVHRGAVDDDLYLVWRGRLQVVAEQGSSAARVLNEIGPGESVGEIAFLSGQKRTATVLASEASEVVRFAKATLDRLRAEHPEALQAIYGALHKQARRRQLRSALRSTKIFGALDPAALSDLEAELSWVTLRSGETLIRQGDPGDCLYVVISGRLRVVLEQDGVEVRALREVGRGESIGEMALITGEKRTATVYAVRDTEVARLSQAAFDRLLIKHPQAMTKTFTRAIIESLNRQLAGEKPGLNRFTTIAIVPLQRDVRLAEFARRLVQALTALGPTLHVSSTVVENEVGQAGLNQLNGADEQEADAQLVNWLSDQETRHRHIVYEVDPTPTPWSQRCLRQADQILLVGHANGDPTPGELETRLLKDTGGRARKRMSLALLHRDRTHPPQGSQRWLTLRQVEQHYHLCWQDDADFSRLARHLAGRAVGLVLGGGAARGYAHLGVIRALEEAGIPIDIVGGTSIGAIIAAQCAMGWDAQTLLEMNREFASSNWYDYTVPVISLLAGRRFTADIQAAFGEILTEDLWLPYFCVSTNLTKADVMVHTDGPLWRNIRASNSLPGLLPPLVHNGDALVDGALLDNLPIGVMRSRCGGGAVIAVDVAPPVDMAKIAPQELSAWHVLHSHLNPLASKSNAPNLMTLLYRSVEVSSVADQRNRVKQGLADIWLRPPVEKFGMVDYQAIAEISEVGYRYAREAIAQWQVDGRTE